MDQFDYDTDVCIVGAGPAGALLSYLLASHHISTILIERHESINKEFRGEHLNETGESILKKYELFDDLEKIGLLRMDAVEYWDEGNLFKQIRPDERIGHVGIHVPQKHLLGLLLEKSEPLEDFSLFLGTKVVDLIEEDGKYVGIKAIRNGKEVKIKSSLIVGSDGRFSTIRKLADIPFQKISHGYDLLWARIPAPIGWEPTIKMALVENQQLAVFTQEGGFIQIGWNIPEDSFPQLRKQSFLPFISNLVEAFPELEQTVREHIVSWDDFVLLKVQSSKSETWVKDNVVIIGDAAHTMSPTGAIGINSAMKDADFLFQTILRANSVQDIGTENLKDFERLRKQEVEMQQKQQLEKEASFGKQFSPV